MYFKNVAKAGDTLSGGLRSFIGSSKFNAMSESNQLVIRSVASNPRGLLDTVVENAGTFTNVFKRMSPDNFKSFYKNMTDEGKTLFRSKITDSSLLRQMDDVDVGGATRSSRRQGDNVQLTKVDGSTKTVKYGGPEFWKTIRTGGLVGAGVGLLTWIDKKFEKEKEDYKNCMAGCLPHNWDEYDYGDLEKSDLQYSTPETLEEYQITPVDGQPYCKAAIDDCEDYCGDRCEEETDVRIPFVDPLRDLTREGAESLGDLLKALFGNLFEGLGLDTEMVGYASSASSSMIMMFAAVMLLSTMTR
jgi:hypothetical protein